MSIQRNWDIHVLPEEWDIHVHPKERDIHVPPEERDIRVPPEERDILVLQRRGASPRFPQGRGRARLARPGPHVAPALPARAGRARRGQVRPPRPGRAAGRRWRPWPGGTRAPSRVSGGRGAGDPRWALRVLGAERAVPPGRSGRCRARPPQPGPASSRRRRNRAPLESPNGSGPAVPLGAPTHPGGGFGAAG